jgi:hypothetical protein
VIGSRVDRTRAGWRGVRAASTCDCKGDRDARGDDTPNSSQAHGRGCFVHGPIDEWSSVVPNGSCAGGPTDGTPVLT